MDEEAEGIVVIGHGGGVHGALRDKVGNQRPTDLGVGQRSAHGDRHEHADGGPIPCSPTSWRTSCPMRPTTFRSRERGRRAPRQ